MMKIRTQVGVAVFTVVGAALVLLSPVSAASAQDHARDQAGEHLPAAQMSENEVAVAEGEHGTSDHGHDHVPHFSDINWVHGFLGEKEGVEPSLLWRPPGTPIPLGALLLNTAILFYLIGRFGGPGIKQGLKDRKQRIAGDIDKAAQMRAEAEDQLAHYEEKLEKMEAEMTRIKKEMQEQAEADRQHIVAEAKERRAVIEADARQLIEQELAQARQEATLKAVSAAVEAAREQIKRSINTQDQERLAGEFLSSLEAQVKKSTGAVS